MEEADLMDYPTRPASPADVPHVLCYVFSLLQQRDLAAACCVCKEWHAIGSHPSFWKVLDLHGKADAGDLMVQLMQKPKFQAVQEVNLEFAQGVDDSHLVALSGLDLRIVNLNACQMVTDDGVIRLAAHCLRLRSFSIYWNLKVTERFLEALAAYCKQLAVLNISGCKNVADSGMVSVAHSCKALTSLNLTRCLKLSDKGLKSMLQERQNLRELWLYALSSLTDASYTALSNLRELRLLDLCGAVNLSDSGLAEIAKCSNLRSLNLTWCIQISDEGLRALAHGCNRLETLSMHGITGVTDEGLAVLAKGNHNSLTTIDVNGCVAVKHKRKEDLLQLFPKLTTFQVHS